MDPEGKKIKPKKEVPRDNYSALVTLLVFVLIVLFTGMCCYSIANKRKTDPTYLPPILRTRAAQKFQFIRRLGEARNHDDQPKLSDAAVADQQYIADQDIDSSGD